MRVTQHRLGAASSTLVVGLVALAAASCTAAPEAPAAPASVGTTAAALSAEDEVRAACKGTHDNHGQCVSCVAHASGDGQLVSDFARGECHDKCIRTSCAVEGKTCGGLADGCGGTLSCGPACAPEPIFLPSENHAAYELRAACTVYTSNRVGSVDMCCRTGSYSIETTCTTALHEERDAAGNLIVRIDPMGACVSTSADLTCNRSGNLPRCDSNSMTCPVQHAAQHGVMQGGPSLLEGTYARTVFSGGEGGGDEYRGACGSAPQAGSLAMTCTPPPSPQPYPVMATFTKSGPGRFAVRRAWGGSMPASQLCVPPMRFSTPLPNTRFVQSAGLAGGTFSLIGYDCTYELTLKP
ncbi:MAG: hypothetical protein IPK71_10550 [Myxococcales bacterium]|nr:hypothetical protein [Myxococcales bacterium]